MATQAPHLYLIALGSNLGDRHAQLDRAAAAIGAEIGPVLARSPDYETAPMGAADQLFLNGALIAQSALAPVDVLKALLAIEAAMGRIRRERWGNRLIDLDLLLWRHLDDPADAPARSLQTPELQLPHPGLLERDFVLVPAATIAGTWRHPATGKTLAEECTTRSYRLDS